MYTLPIIFSGILTLVLIMSAKKLFPGMGLLDKPEKYGLKRTPIPYSVGIILYINFVINTLIFVPLTAKVVGILLAATLIAIVSFADDYKNLSPFLRLGVQTVTAIIIIIAGFEVNLISNPIGNNLMLDTIKISTMGMEISVFSALFIIVWIVGMINTVNFLDGIPGLASGITIIAGVTLFLLAIRPGFHVINQEGLALIIGIVTCSAFIFWFFDFSPPKILMGDSGSTFLGLMLAIFAIFAGAKIATAFIVMGFPIFDVLLTLSKRIIQKKSPFKGDYQHLHHDLLRNGFSERQTILTIYFLSALFGLTALFLDSFEKLMAIIMIFAIMVGLKMYLSKKKSRVVRV